MTLDEYQTQAITTDSFEMVKKSVSSQGFINKVLGLCGESGEFAEKIKKIHRNKDGNINEGDVLELKKELGDTLWYLATLAEYLDLTLDDVAQTNLDKLKDRAKRNVIKSSGDNR